MHEYTAFIIESAHAENREMNLQENITYKTEDDKAKSITIRTGYEIINRTVDKYGRFLFPNDIEVNTWWINLGLNDHRPVPCTWGM